MTMSEGKLEIQNRFGNQTAVYRCKLYAGYDRSGNVIISMPNSEDRNGDTIELILDANAALEVAEGIIMGARTIFDSEKRARERAQKLEKENEKSN